MTCEKCGHTLAVGDYPFCPHERATPAVHGDDIPGGMLIPHAICNPDGTPKRYYSKSEINKELRRKGWVRLGETPKSKNDRWV